MHERIASCFVAMLVIACGSAKEKGKPAAPTAAGTSAVASRQAASPSLPPAAPNDLPEILAIRAQYARINSIVGGCTVHEDPLEGSLEGGVLRSYLCGDSIPKAVAWYYGETYRFHEEYYFEHERPVFVFSVLEHYARTFGPVVSTQENRFYFVRDRLVRWIDDSGAVVPAASERARARADSVLKDAGEVIRRARGDTTALQPRALQHPHAALHIGVADS